MSAIQIYRYEDKKYCFDLKAFKDIIEKSEDNLVAIYSMTGPLRMGKSYMLGFFLKYMKTNGSDDWISHKLDNTFTYKAGAVRETTGIWMWSEPFVVEREDGRKVSVFLMDTQGCFDNKTSMRDNAFVFALSTLLSSVMIFNIQRQLSEDMIQFLQYFAGFARLADEANRDQPFQNLQFLIRDWQFPDYDYGYYDDNTSINGKNFKTNSFDIREDMPKDVKFVHESILSSFEKISFYLMPYPGNAIARGSNFDIESMESDFLHHLSQFVPLVLKEDNIVAKKIGGDYITGAQLINFVEKWSEIFKIDAIPESMTIFEATADIRHEMAKSAAIDNYTRIMKKRLNDAKVMSEIDFNLFHNILFNDSIELFRSFKLLGGKAYEVKHMNLLVDELNKIHDFYSRLNASNLRYKIVKEKAEQQIKRLENEIKDNVKKLTELHDLNEEQKKGYLKTIEENESKLNALRDEKKEENLKNLKLKEENERLLTDWRALYISTEKRRDVEMEKLNEEINELNNTSHKVSKCNIM